MKKTYVTFGETHNHEIRGVKFGQNTIAVIECKDALDGRNQAFQLFGDQFAFEYHEYDFEEVYHLGKTFITVSLNIKVNKIHGALESVGVKDDMNTGAIRMFMQDDGDICLSVIDRETGVSADVEFCLSGGRCPNTLDALRDLMAALAKDSENLPPERLLRKIP